MEIQSGMLADSVAVAKESADAAKQTVQTMRDAERAWLVEGIRFVDSLPRRASSGGGLWIAIVTLKNIGSKPASIRLARIRFHASERLPETPQYGARAPIIGAGGQMIAPNDTSSLRCVLEEVSLDDEQVDAIERSISGGLQLWIYGHIAYDTVGTVGENQFCYKWNNQMGFSIEGDKPGFQKDGPENYNSHL
jgi:hypothetical protein